MTATDHTYVVAGSRPWNREVFDRSLVTLPGHWHFIGRREDLTVEVLEQLDPRYVFFLHWSWIVSSDVFDRWECVVLHMTDVPYGRGGSPLQNLMVRGHDTTMLSALRMAADVDAGPVYSKTPLSLQGTAEEIYRRAGHQSAEMIADIAQNEPEPVEQVGEIVEFDRRTPAESRLPDDLDLAGADRFIRMLDAEGYPHAFVEVGDLRLELRDAELSDGELTARVRIRSTAAAPVEAPTEKRAS